MSGSGAVLFNNRSMPQSDVCLLGFDAEAQPLPISLNLPREGEKVGIVLIPTKHQIGHRLAGEIAQTLNVPVSKVDLDLTVNQQTAIAQYEGASGAAVVSAGSSRNNTRTA